MLLSNKRYGSSGNEWIGVLCSIDSYVPVDEDLFIECWTCSRRKLVDRKYYYSKIGEYNFEHVVVSVGYHCSTDFSNKRVLAFCSEGCDCNARRENGTYKFVRPRMF